MFHLPIELVGSETCGDWIGRINRHPHVYYPWPIAYLDPDKLNHARFLYIAIQLSCAVNSKYLKRCLFMKLNLIPAQSVLQMWSIRVSQQLYSVNCSMQSHMNRHLCNHLEAYLILKRGNNAIISLYIEVNSYRERSWYDKEKLCFCHAGRSDDSQIHFLIYRKSLELICTSCLLSFLLSWPLAWNIIFRMMKTCIQLFQTMNEESCSSFFKTSMIFQKRSCIEKTHTKLNYA